MIWLVGVKIYGYKPIKLTNKIEINIEIINKVIPLCLKGLVDELISLNKLPITEFNKIIPLLLNFQYIRGKKKININDSQFKLNKEEEGSKILKRLFIIFRKNYL